MSLCRHQLTPSPNTFVAAAFALFLAGCASTSPRPAFRDTARLVEGRTGRHIVWNQRGAEDAAVARKVHELLGHELTPDAAIEVALLNNKGLQATYEDLSVAQADLVQAGLLQNPVFGASISFPVAGNVRTGASLSVSQDFLGVFLLAARKRVAEAQLRATKLRVGDAVLRRPTRSRRHSMTSLRRSRWPRCGRRSSRRAMRPSTWRIGNTKRGTSATSTSRIKKRSTSSS